VRERLEDRLRPIVLAGVHGLAEEAAMRDLIGRRVRLRRIASLLAGQIEADDGQALFPREHRRLRQLL
jgi:hypothetical protein